MSKMLTVCYVPGDSAKNRFAHTPTAVIQFGRQSKNWQGKFVASATPEPGNNKTNVIALGGNAILSDGDSGDVAQQMRSMELACRHLVPLFSSGNGMVITHGQIGTHISNECWTRFFVVRAFRGT